MMCGTNGQTHTHTHAPKKRVVGPKHDESKEGADGHVVPISPQVPMRSSNLHSLLQPASPKKANWGVADGKKKLRFGDGRAILSFRNPPSSASPQGRLSWQCFGNLGLVTPQRRPPCFVQY